MISESKILQFYAEALELAHPDPDRAIFGRLGISGGDESYSKDGVSGLFAVSDKLTKSVGMDVTDNAEASFKAMIHFDTKHIGEHADIGVGMSKTAAEKDVQAYMKKLDRSVSEYKDKIEWEAGSPVAFKTVVDNVDNTDPLEDKDSVDEVKLEAKKLAAEYANESSGRAALGLEVDAKGEYNRLVDLLKGAINKMV